MVRSQVLYPTELQPRQASKYSHVSRSNEQGGSFIRSFPVSCASNLVLMRVAGLEPTIAGFKVDRGTAQTPFRPNRYAQQIFETADDAGPVQSSPVLARDKAVYRALAFLAGDRDF